MSKDTAILKTGVFVELIGSEPRYTVWAKTWDGTLYFDAGCANLGTWADCLERAHDAILYKEHVNNGSWVKGSFG